MVDSVLRPPLPPVPIPAATYRDMVWVHLKTFEGAVGRIYTDGKGIPTMGAGNALAVIGRGGLWQLRPAAEIGAEIAAPPYRFTAEEWQRLTACLRAAAAGAVAIAQALVPPFDPARETSERNRFGFALNDAAMQAQALAKWSVARGAVRNGLLAEAARRGWPSAEAAAYAEAFALSRQELGLASVRYNIGSGRATPRSDAAVLDGDRAALWYEIAYDTNPPGNGASREGIARRRLAEARLACGDPTGWSTAERTRLDAILAANSDRVAAYRRAVPGAFADPSPDDDPPPGGAAALAA